MGGQPSMAVKWSTGGFDSSGETVTFESLEFAFHTLSPKGPWELTVSLFRNFDWVAQGVHQPVCPSEQGSR